MKGGEYDQEDRAVLNKEFSEYDICVATKDGLPTSMQDELDYKYNYYCSVPHQEWYDLLSTTEAKENISGGSSWEISSGGNTSQPSRIMSIIPTMTL